ncbi:Uncharacterised protein [Mycobacteroides abscessus subsp. abscessus]|nr:Uncharacterised protein [Mycobacteroides abscessus subsp. abscessus]
MVLFGAVRPRQKWAYHAAAGTPNALCGTDFQIHHGVPGECLTYARGQYGAAAQRHDPVLLVERPPNH